MNDPNSGGYYAPPPDPYGETHSGRSSTPGYPSQPSTQQPGWSPTTPGQYNPSPAPTPQSWSAGEPQPQSWRPDAQPSSSGPQYPPQQYGQSQYGQPQYGQSQYGQPQYGQQYQQPDYTQPQQYTPQQPYAPGAATPPSQPYGQDYTQQYGQPPYGTTPAPYGFPPQPPQKSGVAVRVLGIVLAVAVLGGVGTFLAIHFAGNSKPSAAPSTPTLTSPSAHASSPAPSSAPSGSSIFKLPSTAAGMKLQPSSDLNRQMAGALPDALAAQTTVGLYSDPANPQKLLILIGAQTQVGSPEATLAGVFAGMATSADSQLGTPKKYSAGSLGGEMECASGSLNTAGAKVPVGVCAVADSHGIILTIFTSRTASQAATATRTVRSAFEHP